MNYVIINALLYISLLIIYWKKRKTIDCGFLLIVVWTLVAVCGVFLYLDDPIQWTLTLTPFLYLFVAFILFSRIYIFRASKWNDAMGDFVYNKNATFNFMCIIFIICAIFNILNTDFSVSSMSLGEVEKNALDNYGEHIEHYGEAAYTNIIERFTLNYCSWFKVAALIGMYNCFCQKRNGMAFTLGACIFLPTLMNSIMMGTRGTLFTEIMLFLSAFLLYKKYIPKETKKRIYAIASFVGVFSLLFVIAVTTSRFADSKEGTGGSVLSYFGQAMLYFNNGLYDSVNGMLYGLRTFKTITSYFGVSLPEGFRADFFLGTDFGTGFTTAIGMLILDFGFIGTLVLVIILPSIINYLCSYRKTFTVASLYLFLFFFNRLIFGVFTNGSGADLQYIIAIFFYFFFRFALDTKKKPTVIVAQNNIV